MASFRYWGLRVRSCADGSTTGLNIGDIEFAESSSGANIAAGLATNTNGIYTSGPGQDKAFDGSVGNVASAGADHNFAVQYPGGAPVLVWCDFGTAKSIVRCTVIACEVAFQSSNPGAYDVIGSNDATNWTTVWTPPPVTAWKDIEAKTSFDPSYQIPPYRGSRWGTHRYWRMMFGVNSGGTDGYIALNKAEFRNRPGGVSATMINNAGSPIAGSELGGYPATAAFDNNSNSAWASASNKTYGSYLGYAFNSPVSISQVMIGARTDQYFAQAPLAALVQWSDDNVVWTTAFWIDHSAPWTQGEQFLASDPNFVEPPAVRYTLTNAAPKAVFSTRRLTSYTGPLLQVKDSTGTLTDIGSISANDGRLNTAAVLAVAGGGDVQVQKWYDQSGNGYDAVASSANGPRIVVAGVLQTIGGSPAISFQGNAFNFTYGFWKTPFTVLSAQYMRNTQGWGCWLSNQVGGGTNIGFGYVLGNDGRYNLQKNGLEDRGSNLINDSTIEIAGWTSAAGRPTTGIGAALPYKNNIAGNSELNIDYGSQTTSDNARIGSSTSNGDSYNGWISEIVIWDSVIAERPVAAQRMAGFYGAPVAGADAANSGAVYMTAPEVIGRRRTMILSL